MKKLFLKSLICLHRMTHGAGTFSSHSRGHCSTSTSTSVWTTSSVHDVGRQTSTTSGDVNDGCEQCACCLCALIGTFICCYKTTLEARIYILWVWLVIVSATAGCLLKFNVFAQTEFAVSPTDSRIVTRPGSGLFCQNSIFQSNLDFRVSVFSSPPNVDSTSSRSTTFTATVSDSITPNGYVYWGFYLLEGSTVSVRPCPESGAPLFNSNQYIIKGKRNLERMMQDKCEGSPCFLHVKYQLSMCNSWTKNNVFNYTFNDSDDYYFFYAGGASRFIKVDFHLRRTNFDYSHVIESYNCSAFKDCIIPIPPTPAAALVYQAPNTTNFDINLTVDYGPRVLMYVVLFFFTPLMIGLFISCIMYIKCKKSTSNRSSAASNQQQGQRSEEGQSRQAQQRSRPHVSFHDAPPKYETLVNEVSETAPPPYPGVQAVN